MEREACVCDHGFERSDFCAEIIIIIIIIYDIPEDNRFPKCLQLLVFIPNCRAPYITRSMMAILRFSNLLAERDCIIVLWVQ